MNNLIKTFRKIKIEESESEVSRENLCGYIKSEPYRIVEVDDRYVDLKLSSTTLCTEKNVKTETEVEDRYVDLGYIRLVK